MLTEEQIAALRAPFPPAALTPDYSRGFELTSIRAAYVIERLNAVFGPCGSGWRYVHTPFEDLLMVDQRTEVLTEVALQYRVSDDEHRGCPPVEWRDRWVPDYDRGAFWSEPIYATGGHALGSGGIPYTDARKSAVTNGLSKAASMLGIGHEVYKGLVGGDADRGNGHHGNGTPRDGNAANPTAFWALYHNAAKPLGISLEVAKDLAARGDWDVACADLHALVEEAR